MEKLIDVVEKQLLVNQVLEAEEKKETTWEMFDGALDAAAEFEDPDTFCAIIKKYPEHSEKLFSELRSIVHEMQDETEEDATAFVEKLFQRAKDPDVECE